MNRLRSLDLPAAVEHVRDAVRAGDLDSRPDPDLLDRFARYGEHAAFDALLRRHGPMVLGVCRRMLPNPADADDAFQATFLVFVRKARVVRHPDRLGPWLYGVAFRVAGKARARAARTAVRQTEATDMIPDPSPPPAEPDWLPVLDAELATLPTKYREPMVLCELQGLSRAAAAKALGIPEGTLSSRLARGRDLLRRRLLKHGTLLPAGGLAALLAAHGSGRAAAPAGLFTLTSELAKGTPGVVPAGPARLTDEVLKGMLLTKLRVAGGAILAAGLVAVGLLAAWPPEAPAQPKDAKPALKTAAAPAPQPAAKPAPAGPQAPDRDVLQGLWVLEKIDLSKAVKGEHQKELDEMPGKFRLLVAGDVWWMLFEGPKGDVMPHAARIDPAKNPKWLDLTVWHPDGKTEPPTRHIYELDGENLRLTFPVGNNSARPAEFALDEGELAVMSFRREKTPPPAGEKSLVGSWVDQVERIGVDEGKQYRGPAHRVEILDGFLFVQLPRRNANDSRPTWVGGRYTVDTTKNPRWIDLELVSPFPEEKVTKLYGSYEAGENGSLKMALVLHGSRAFRPLDLRPPEAGDVLFLDLKPVPPGVPQPGPPQPAPPPAKPVDKPLTDPKPPAPAQPPPDLPTPQDQATAAHELMKAGKFGEAEDVLRKFLDSDPFRPRAQLARFLLGVCLLRLPPGGDDAPTVERRRKEALDLFRRVRAELMAQKRADGGKLDAADEWLLTQTHLRVLQAHHLLGRPDELVNEAAGLLNVYNGTVEELIVLSLMYHAHRQANRPELAAKTRDRMKEVFAHLDPKAFKADAGEYSRAYWEKTWFADGAKENPGGPAELPLPRP